MEESLLTAIVKEFPEMSPRDRNNKPTAPRAGHLFGNSLKYKEMKWEFSHHFFCRLQERRSCAALATTATGISVVSELSTTCDLHL